MKTRRPLWKLSITTTFEAEDAITEMLGDVLGSPVSAYFDFEKKINRLTVFATEKIQSDNHKKVLEGLKHIQRCGLDIGAGRITIARVSGQDWAESWKRHFKPIEIAGQLMVKPDWSRKRPRKNQAVVILNPGLSFGTGQHPTTEFCLEEIVRNFTGLSRSSGNAPSFLDIGTGSGILAIGAAKMGYKPVYAMDFDVDAVRIARANARRNGVLRKMKILHGDVAKLPLKPRKHFNLVCANLISDLIIKERERIIAQLAPGGILVLAGILRKEFLGVRQVFEKRGLQMSSSRRKKEWWSGSFCLA